MAFIGGMLGGLVFAIVFCVITKAFPDGQVCYNRCVVKIPDATICNETCESIINTPTISNSSGINSSVLVPPVPSPPHFVSHTYRTLTVGWLPGPGFDYNLTVVRYILEVRRHKNVSDPLIILPVVQRYHVVSTSEFTSPLLEALTNYTMRVASVSAYGTKGFSTYSDVHETNRSCDATIQHGSNLSFPCPVTDIRMRVTTRLAADRKEFEVTASIYWTLPYDIDVLQTEEFKIKVISASQDSETCEAFGFTFSSWKIGKFTNQTLVKKKHDGRSVYLGCRYTVQFSGLHIASENYFRTSAHFYIPECIQGFCACKRETQKTTSSHIAVDFQKPTAVNAYVNGTVSFDSWAWGQHVNISYYILFIELLDIWIDVCQPFRHLNTRYTIFVQETTEMRNHSHVFQFVSGCAFRVKVAVRDEMACLLSPSLVSSNFKATYVPTPPSSATQLPTATTTASEPKVTSGITSPTSAYTGSEPAGISSGLIAIAVIMPLICITLVVFLLLLCRFKCHQKNSSTLRRTPTGLRRLADTPNMESHIYQRNLDQTNTMFSYNDNPSLVVNLPPPKNPGAGLELNPAYVEQRIHEAITTGEADDYEFGFHRLELGRKIGTGAFGNVYIADAFGVNGNAGVMTVAVKILKEHAIEDEKEDFKMEINFMKTLGVHENVIRILGCCTLYDPLCLIVEYIPYGDLLHYLRDLRKRFEHENRKQQQLTDALFPKRNGHKSSAGSRHSLRSNKSPAPLRAFSFSSNTLRGSHRRLAPSLSDTRKYEKFFEPGELEKGKLKNRRSLSATSLTIARGLSSLFPRHRKNSLRETDSLYVGRGEEGINRVHSTTCLTTVGDYDSRPQPEASASGGPQAQAVCLDGALDSTELQSFAFQIANGMEYLSSRGVLHRDLAARNILVGDEKVLKISDFGLSREGVYVKRSTGKIPLRWLSIESMRDRTYSTASDIWSFGIVLWEICTLGGFPYPTVNDRDLLRFLLEGKRMDKPSNCSDEIYNLMLACWSRDVADRPPFETLRDILWDMQKEENPYVNVDPSQDFILPPVTEDSMENLMLFSDGSSHVLLDRNLPRKNTSSSDEDMFDGLRQDQEEGAPTEAACDSLMLVDPTVLESERNKGYESSDSCSSHHQQGIRLLDMSDKEASNRTSRSPRMGRRLSVELENALDESAV